MTTPEQAPLGLSRRGAPGPFQARVSPAGGACSPERLEQLSRERGRLYGEIECLEAELFRLNLRRALHPSETLPPPAHVTLRRYVEKRRRLAALQLEIGRPTR